MKKKIYIIVSVVLYIIGVSLLSIYSIRNNGEFDFAHILLRFFLNLSALYIPLLFPYKNGSSMKKYLSYTFISLMLFLLESFQQGAFINESTVVSVVLKSK